MTWRPRVPARFPLSLGQSSRLSISPRSPLSRGFVAGGEGFGAYAAALVIMVVVSGAKLVSALTPESSPVPPLVCSLVLEPEQHWVCAMELEGVVIPTSIQLDDTNFGSWTFYNCGCECP